MIWLAPKNTFRRCCFKGQRAEQVCELAKHIRRLRANCRCYPGHLAKLSADAAWFDRTRWCNDLQFTSSSDDIVLRVGSGRTDDLSESSCRRTERRPRVYGLGTEAIAGGSMSLSRVCITSNTSR